MGFLRCPHTVFLYYLIECIVFLPYHLTLFVIISYQCKLQLLYFMYYLFVMVYYLSKDKGYWCISSPSNLLSAIFPYIEMCHMTLGKKNLLDRCTRLKGLFSCLQGASISFHNNFVMSNFYSLPSLSPIKCFPPLISQYLY